MKFSINLDMGGFSAEVIGTCRPGHAAKTNCLPEDSYPSEGDEIEVNDVNLYSMSEPDVFRIGLLNEEIEQFAERYASQIKDALIDGGYL